MTISNKKQVVQGIIAVTRRGVGYLPHKNFDEDIELQPDALNCALNGDEVEVEVTKRDPKRATGSVTRVLQREREEFVGVLKKKDGSFVLIPDDERVYKHFHIPEKEAADAVEGHKALVRLTQWNNPNLPPMGSLIKVIGPAGAHETEMQATLATHGFIYDFPHDVIQEAERIQAAREISEEDISERRDFRKVPTFTIDPEDAKDFDDALSIQGKGSGLWEVGIHIADVTHYVKPGMAIDDEARNRATSVYLVDRTIPMLPEVISNDICSLRPDEDRLAFSAVFTIDAGGRVHERWFGRTVIRSQKRFTYREAQDILDTKTGQFQEELERLKNIAAALQKEREKEGSIAFDTDEVRFELDEDGVPVRAYVKERLETMRMIEDWMLLANREVAGFIAKETKNDKTVSETFIYRIHDTPKPERIEELKIFLRAIGYDLGKKGEDQIVSKDINKLLRDVAGKPEEKLVQMATLRSMAKAVYSHRNIGHFSLGFKNYTHFTSPIRRYPDMMVHRILASHLGGTQIAKDEFERYRKMAIHASEREVEAVEAERDSVKFKQVEYMAKRIGQTFEGTISGVTEFGIFVEEKSTKAEGLVRLSALSDDYYDYNPKKYALVGKRTKRAFRLGDTVTIKLKSASPDTRKIDWEIVQK